MGELSVRARQSGIKGLPEGARLLERVARPLTGLEVKEALTRHILALAGEFDSESKTWERFEREIGNTLDRISELNKLNLVYPGVGWNVKVTLEQSELGLENLWALVQLDLEPGKRKNIAIGGSRGWKIFLEREEEQLQTKVPDVVRERHQLPIEVDYITPSGQRGRVARSVEIGGAAQVAPKIERDEAGLTSPEHQAEAREMAVQVSVAAAPPKEKEFVELVTERLVPVDMNVEDLVGQAPGVEAPKPKPKVGRPVGRVSYTTLKERKDGKSS